MVTCVLAAAQAFALVDVIVPVFTEGSGLSDIVPAVAWLVGIFLVRTVVAFLTEYTALRASAGAKRELRQAAMRRIMNRGPTWLARRNTGDLTQLVTRGVDGLDAYFARYLPQLILAVVVPLTLTLVVLSQDLTAALIVLVTVPLIPIFMILIGKFTRRRIDRQWRVMGVLAGHFMDVMAGMATLKAFGRARAQGAQVLRVSEEYRRTTLGVLRVSFLSSLVLELVAMLSVALVAVSIGVRLVDGAMSLREGLIVLILIPEIYLPLRLIGTHYHAAAAGLGAAGRLLEIIDDPTSQPTAGAEVPDLRLCHIEFRQVTVDFGLGRGVALDAVDLTIAPGRITAITGPSGSGKSTALGLLERFTRPSAGSIVVTDPAHGSRELDLEDLDLATWRARVGWVGQAPLLIPGSLGANVRHAAPTATDDDVNAALDAVGLGALVDQLPDGLETRVGEGGRLLSLGQVRRIAFARLLCADPELVILDEPTAALDGSNEDLLIDEIRKLATGRTVVLVAHREALVDIADDVIELNHGRVVTSNRAALVGGST